MELKYYLRGLGLGIIVTAIIMGVAVPGRQKMSDEEIISRAKQLGMIEDRVLSETAQEKEADSGNEDSSDGEDASEQEDASDSEEVPLGQNTESDKTAVPEMSAMGQDEGDKEEQAQERDVIETGSNADMQAETELENNEEERLPLSNAPMVITIGSGDGSYAVSKKLADIGAISSPENFDTFLCENGYDKKIRTGTYTIPADASDEQMARIITGAE